MDSHRAPFEDRLLLGHCVFDEDEFQRQRVQLGVQRSQLSIEFVDEAPGGRLLAIEIGEVRRNVARLAREALSLRLQIFAFLPDGIEPSLILSNLTVDIPSLCNGGLRERRQHAHQRKCRSHTRRNCLPTLLALANSPKAVPNATTSDIWDRSKNSASKSNRCIAAYAA